MTDEAQDLLVMFAALRKQGKTSPEQWRELAEALKPVEPLQPKLLEVA